jgi:hypothetical protein
LPAFIKDLITSPDLEFVVDGIGEDDEEFLIIYAEFLAPPTGE